MIEKHIFNGIKNLDLKETFECGQCFRWNMEEDGSYTGIAMNNPANIRLEGDVLTVEGFGSREFWEEYLDLKADYEKLQQVLCEGECEILPQAINCGSGIRILRQDPFEMLISFIISQRKNIPAIKASIEKLCALAGHVIAEDETIGKIYSFPR